MTAIGPGSPDDLSALVAWLNVRDTPVRRLLWTGSRTWHPASTVWDVMGAVHRDPWSELVVVHGACGQGADKLVRRWVAVRGFPTRVTEERHPADWSLGRRAGPLRNQHMVDLDADLCVALIRDGSPGASGCADMAEKAGIPTWRCLA